MFNNDATRFPSSPGSFPSQPEYTPQAVFYSEAKYGGSFRSTEPDAPHFLSETQGRDLWAERYGFRIVLGFTAAFALFLIGMALFGQTPGKSLLLKSVSDILQFAGEGIGCILCTRIALRLHRVSVHLRNEMFQKETQGCTQSEMAKVRTKAQTAQRAYLAWTLLAIAIALYAGGQAIWTSYDVRLSSANVPFPGLYDIGFVSSYPFFLAGTLLLTRHNKASAQHFRLLLDVLAVIGTALAFSWFFLLAPSIAGLAQTPSDGAAFLSIYFPTGDLFLVAVGTFLMFSTLANRAQQPVFMLLCLGLFFLAVTDSLLGYYNLTGGFNTGTLQDILWPLSLSLVGLAAVEYPRGVASEQMQMEHVGSPGQSLLTRSRSSQVITIAQTILPFILVLLTCTVLLTVIAPRGGSTLIQADIVALILILIVVVRQALTLIENNRLTMQIRGELVISRRELQVTRREVNEASRTAQEKQVLEDGIATLRSVHARVARGDFAARAPSTSGPLLPIAISLNLMLERLGALSQRGARYDHLAKECKILQEAVERLSEGLPPVPVETLQSITELRPIFLGLAHLQRTQQSQWRRQESSLEFITGLTRRIRETLHEIINSKLFTDPRSVPFERMIVERVIREVNLLEQQQSLLFSQTKQLGPHSKQATPVNTLTDSIGAIQPVKQTGQFQLWDLTERPLQQGQTRQYSPQEETN